MQVKTCPAQIKAAGTHEGTDEGIVEAIVAAYNVDSVGDRIIPGAFAKTLARRKENGTVIPFVWSHKSDDPEYHIGEVLEAEERPEGLWVKARVDLDEPKAAKAYRLIKGRRISNYSFAYDEIDARPAAKSDDGAKQDLFELELHECGPTMIGANRQTSTVGVKHEQGVTVNVNTLGEGMNFSGPAAEKAAAKISDSAAELKAGRTLSKQNEDRVAEIARLASELLASVKSEAATGDGEPAAGSNAEKAAPTEPAVASDPQAAPQAAPESKSDEPAASGVARERLRHELDLLELESYTI